VKHTQSRNRKEKSQPSEQGMKAVSCETRYIIVAGLVLSIIGRGSATVVDKGTDAQRSCELLVQNSFRNQDEARSAGDAANNVVALSVRTPPRTIESRCMSPEVCRFLDAGNTRRSILPPRSPCHETDSAKSAHLPLNETGGFRSQGNEPAFFCVSNRDGFGAHGLLRSGGLAPLR
jgi:hypothetical protein